MKKKICIALIGIVILLSICIPIKKGQYEYYEYIGAKNNILAISTYSAYYNIYGMKIYKVLIDYDEFYEM